MKTRIFVLVCFATIIGPSLSLVARAESSAAKSSAVNTPEFKTMHVADLESAMAKDKTVSVYDANGDDTRSHVGLIHGAHALTSYDKYAASELPADKMTPVVFYCANTMCTASHEAAKHALVLGYKNVSVMVDGIYGWKKAGKQIDSFASKDSLALTTDAKNANEITPVEAKNLVDEKRAIIVDVRETEERHEVVPTAQSLPLSTDGTPAWNSFVQNLDKSKTIVFHCAIGKRAKRVADELAKQGFRTSFFKGPEQWKAAGLKLEAGPSL